MNRCEYKSDELGLMSGFRHDGSDQCWVTDTANFGSEDAPELYCLFHAAYDKEPIDRTPWPLVNRGVMQARHFKKLLNQWSNLALIKKEKGLQILPFILPEMWCGSVNLTGYKFVGKLHLNGAHFTGLTDFSRAQFGGNVSFKRAMFHDTIDFRESVFEKGADFCETVFRGNGYFSEATFSSDVDFDNVEFLANGYFKKTVFQGHTFIYDAKFVGTAAFKGATFKNKVIY